MAAYVKNIPDIWKCADTVPLDKVTPPSQLEKELRPLSITYILSKVLEEFICWWIMQVAGQYINNRQFGSIKGNSTVHALTDMTHKCRVSGFSQRHVAHTIS